MLSAILHHGELPGWCRRGGEHSWRCCRLAPGTAGRNLCLSTLPLSTPNRLPPCPCCLQAAREAGAQPLPCPPAAAEQAPCSVSPPGREPWAASTPAVVLSLLPAPTGDSGCRTGGCGAGLVKGSVRAALIVLGAGGTAAWTASLFGREKARTGAVRVSRSHARLETRPRAQTINARGRREGRGGVGMSGAGENTGGLTDRQTDHVPTRCVKAQRSLCCISCHQQHPNFSLHCYSCSVGHKVLS